MATKRTTKRAKPAAKRAVRVARNVAAGFTTGKGKSAKFTPYRSSPDYDPRRLKSSTAGKAAEVKLAAKRKRQYAAGMKKAAAKMKNPGLRRVKGSTSRATLLWYASKMPFYTTITRSGSSYGLYVDLGNEAKAKSIIAGSSLLREVAKMKNPLPTNKWTKVDKVKVRSDGTIQIMIRPGR